MAKKRRIIESESGRAARESEEKQETEVGRKGQSMGEWFRSTYAKYWFVILSIAADVFGGLQFASLLSGSLGVIAALVFLAAAIVVEILLFRRLWPKGELEE